MGSNVKQSAVAEKRPESAARERLKRVHRILRDRICLLDYLPGQRLGEEDLAAEFGSSRTPIRRVLGWLEAEGLIERRHGVGTIVTEADPETFDQVFRLRLEIASLMGRLAPMNCGTSQLDALETHRKNCRKLARNPDPAQFVRLHMDFDLDVISMIGNAPLREIAERLYFLTTRIWIRSILATDEIQKEIRGLERKIVDVTDALRVKDYVAVGDTCRSHIAMDLVHKRQLMMDEENEVSALPM